MRCRVALPKERGDTVVRHCDRPAQFAVERVYPPMVAPEGAVRRSPGAGDPEARAVRQGGGAHMTAFGDLLAAVARRPHGREEYEASRTYRDLRARAGYHRTAHLLRTVLGLDPEDDDQAELFGEQFGDNGPSSGIVGVSLPTGPLWFHEEDGRLYAESLQDDASSGPTVEVKTLADLAAYVEAHPPYGWHMSEDPPYRAHIGPADDCKICRPCCEDCS
jgi:hypothetical protein